jgi:hypothetical protein
MRTTSALVVASFHQVSPCLTDRHFNDGSSREAFSSDGRVDDLVHVLSEL